ncbi:anti-phage dCTP deaminase [Planctomycetota bacterium]
MSNHLTHEMDCELVIGLVAAVGTELDQATNLLEEQLALAGYDSEVIKISDEIIELVDVPKTWTTKFERYQNLMDAGNEARRIACEREAKTPMHDRIGDAVLAFGTAAQIFLRREKVKGVPMPHGKKAFIIRSLKRPEEVEALRMIYPEGFVLVGIHSDRSRRWEHLTKNLGMSDVEATTLIDRDRDEVREKHGQRVNKTFHLADFFIHASTDNAQMRCDVRRMVELWFGCPFHTPTFDEYAMFMAFSAALRSADLSRQVGAVVARDNQILSTGANECPKAGGGLYWPTRGESCISDFPDGRDFMRGFDSNRKAQSEILDEIRKIVQTSLKLDSGKKADREKLDAVNSALERSQIRDLTEYGRVVHAEMEALLSCGRSGNSTVHADVYCTTFPCHNCAKHIVAAGIDRVTYIEPYAKSKALEFHKESISSAMKLECDENRVLFQPFVGIGPRRFFDLFSMNLGSSYDIVRKDRQSGRKVEWSIQNARLRVQMKPSSYLDLETQTSERFKEFRV